jgi:outer membrane protein assembly factor BamD
MRKALVLGLLILLAACSTKKANEGFLAEVGNMSKEEILARGNELFAKRKFPDARKYYSFLADSFPNDPLGRQAALKVADSYYESKDVESLTEAQLRYKDFANRFPSDPGRAYALVMLGKCSLHKSKGPLRDLKPVHEAVDSFQQVVEQFPDSQYTPEARELLAKCEEELAEHELEVARFYANVKAWEGAYLRLTYLLATYPDTAAAKAGSKLLVKVNQHRQARSSQQPAGVAASGSTPPQGR